VDWILPIAWSRGDPTLFTRERFFEFNFGSFHSKQAGSRLRLLPENNMIVEAELQTRVYPFPFSFRPVDGVEISLVQMRIPNSNKMREQR